MRYLLTILARWPTPERRIACGFRTGPLRHAHARIGSFLCRGTRQLKRLPTITDTPGDIIAVTTVMAITTTGHIMATATDGPMVTVMGVAGATKIPIVSRR